MFIRLMDGVRGFELYLNYFFEVMMFVIESWVFDCVIKYFVGWFFGGVNGSGVWSIF